MCLTARPSRRSPAPTRPAVSKDSTSGRSWARRRRWTTRRPCSQVRDQTNYHMLHEIMWGFFEQGFLRVRNDPVRIWLCKMLIQASKSFTSVVYCTVNSTPSRVLSVRENVNSLFLPLRESRPLRADMPSLWLWRKLWMFCLFLVCRKRHKLICHKKNKKHGVFLLELQRNFELNSLKASLFPVLVLSGVWGVGC